MGLWKRWKRKRKMLFQHKHTDIDAISSLNILKSEWKKYDRATKNDKENLVWLFSRMDLLKAAGIGRFIALRMLKAEV